jgi:hypothetical protein
MEFIDKAEGTLLQRYGVGSLAGDHSSLVDEVTRELKRLIDDQVYEGLEF